MIDESSKTLAIPSLVARPLAAPAPPPTIACRCCGQTNTRLIGRGARGRQFAGAPLNPVRDGGWLYRCEHCDLLMRHPLLSADEYLALYAPSAATFWTGSELRPEQRRIGEHIRRVLPDGGRVLDVGCAAGDLLHALGPAYEKFGVEPSAQARSRAEALGIHVICGAVEELAASDLRFDVISAVDVIEHVPNPMDFLRLLARNLNDGGQIVVSTGNSRASAWLLCGPVYYYSHCFEHVTFISDRWCSYAAQHGFRVQVLQALFRHEGAAPVGRARRLKMQLRFALKWLLGGFERAVLLRLPTSTRRLGLRLTLAEPGLFNDHIMVSFSPLRAGESAAPHVNE
jgi:SAM-dependent methyltransferase